MEPRAPLSAPISAPNQVPVPATRRAALGLMLGLGGTLGLGLGGRIPRSPGRTALWAADRAGHRVLGLDGDGIVTCIVAVTSPVAVQAAARPMEWTIYSAVESRPDGPLEQVTVGPEGAILGRRNCTREEVPLGPRVPIEPGPAGVQRLWTVQCCGDLGPPAARASERSMRLTDAKPQHLCRWVGRRGKWQRAFNIPLPFRTRAIAPMQGGVWVGDEARCRLWFVNRQGCVVIRRSFHDADGIDALLAASPESGGGVWVAAGGAILRLGREGDRLPGQGGFLHVVDLCSAVTPV